MVLIDHLLQFCNQCSQLHNGFLQSSYSILARLEGGLLETGGGFKVHHLVLQEKDILQAKINPVMHCLPLLGKDDVILLNGVLDHIGSGQHLLSMLLSVCLNPTDLGSVGSPLHLCIIYLKEVELVCYQEAYSLFSYLGFQFYYPG